MSVPARKKSSSSVKRRRSHKALKAVGAGSCERCKTAVRPHRACTNCGFYKGRDVLDVSRKAKRALASTQAAAPAKEAEEK